jgi:hypothetical protein
MEVSATSFALTGLLPSTEYQWKVSELCSSSPELFSDNSKPAFFTTAPLKLNEEQNISSNEVSVFPNPASQILNIRCSSIPDFSNSSESINGSLLITNLLGEIVFTQNAIASVMSVDVSSFASGVYLLQIKTGGEIMTKRFLKE